MRLSIAVGGNIFIAFTGVPSFVPGESPVPGPRASAPVKMIAQEFPGIGPE